MTDDLSFACTCGKLRGHLDPAAVAHGTRTVCFCIDCRTAEIALGQPDPVTDGVNLLQTTPDMVAIDQGAKFLGLMRLSPRGLYRWYATCCDAPLFNTLRVRSAPFVGIQTNRLADPAAAGPVRVRGYVPGPDGKLRHQGATRMAWGIFNRMGSALISGRWRKTPHFDASGAPMAKARILSKSERAAATPDQRRTSG